MTLDEAIKHCEEVAIEYEAKGECFECGKEHRQLAEWLKELKKYKEIKEHLKPTSPCLKCSEAERAACCGCPEYESWKKMQS